MNRLSKSLLVFASTTLFATTSLSAATLNWDGSDTVTTDAQGGTGTWDTGTTANWWDGASDVIWPVSSSLADSAIFGGTAGTVTLSGTVTANALTFNTTGYTLTGGTLTLDGTTPTITTAPGVTATINSTIGGSAGLTTGGTGTLVLTGANNYTGGTNIATGSTLQLGTGGALGTGSIVNNGSLVYNQAAAITVPTALSGTGNLSVTSTNNTVTVGSALNLGGNITLNAYTNTSVTANITAGGALSIQPGNGNNSGLALSGVTLTATSINLGVTGIGATGFGTQTLTLDTSAANGNISIGGDVGRNGNVAPNPQGSMFASMIVNAGTGTITLSAAKAGYIGNLSNTFNGAVVLANNTTFDPKDSSYNGGNVIGGSATFNGTVDLGGKVLQGGTGTANPWGLGFGNTLTFTGTSVGNGTLSTGTAAVVFNTAGSQSVGATINNGLVAAGSAGTVTKTGAGTTTFTATNTYTGATIITAGTLSIATLNNGGVAGNLGQAGNAAANLQLDGGTLQYTGATASTDRAFTITAAKTGTFEITNAATNLTISGAGANTTGSLAKTGSGTLTLSGANAFSGNTTVGAGTLNLSNANALGSSTFAGGAGTLVFDASVVSHAFAFGGLSGSSNLALQDNAGSPNAVALTVGANNATTSYSGNLTGSGSLTKSGAGTLTLAGTNGYTGATTVANGTLSVTGSIATTTAVTLGGSGGTSGSLSINAGDRAIASLTTAVGGGAGSTLTYNAAGTNNGLTITGLTTLNSKLNIQKGTTQGQVSFNGITGSGVAAGNDALTFLTAGNNRLYINGNTGTYNYTGNVRFLAGSGQYTFQSGSFFTNNTSVSVDSGALIQTNWNGTFAFDALTGAGQWDIYNGSSSTVSIGNGGGSGTFTGAITNSAGTNTVIKNGAGTQTFSGANTYSGNTTVNAGTLQFAKQVSLYNNATANWTATKLVVNSGATAAFNVGGANEFTSANIDTLKALGTASGGFKNGSFIGLDTTNAGGNFTYATAIANTNGGANALGLVKLGAGSLTLGGVNTYTGKTVVSVGTLNVGAAGAIGVNGANGITIASGATLVLAGTLEITALTDTIANAGTFTAGGTLDLNGIFDGYNGGANGSYNLITGAGAKNGNFSSITGYNLANWNSVTFDNATGNLVFTAVPEPSTYGLIGAGALASVAFVRRRRKLAGS